MRTAEIVATLRSCELFETLAQDELQTMANLCQEEICEQGKTIYQQDERSEKLYVIEEGLVALNRFIRPDRATFLTIDLLKEGRVFGWSALIEPHVHTASALCLRPTRILAINGLDLNLVLQKDPRVGFEVMQRLARLLGSRLKASWAVLDSKL